MNELILPVVDQKVGLLKWNFEQINSTLDTYLEKYQNLHVSQDDIKEAREIKQELNRVKNQIEDRRKAAKAEFCKPYEVFAEQVKVVTGKIDAVTGNIDSQLKTYEAEEKEKKKSQIWEYWENECTTSPAIPFEKVFDPRMLNKTCTEKQWKKALDEKKESAETALTSIGNIEDNQKRDYVLNAFLDTLDLGKALQQYEMYAEQLRRAEEFRRRAAEKAKATVEKLNLTEETPNKAENRPIPAVTEQPRPNIQAEPKDPQEPIYHRCMEVWGTRQDIIDIADFLNARGIKFRKVELKENGNSK